MKIKRENILVFHQNSVLIVDWRPPTSIATHPHLPAIRQRPSIPAPFIFTITPAQLAFYSKTVFRLMQAGEPPVSALFEFDAVFGCTPKPVSAIKISADNVDGESNSVASRC